MSCFLVLSCKMKVLSSRSVQLWGRDFMQLSGSQRICPGSLEDDLSIFGVS